MTNSAVPSGDINENEGAEGLMVEGESLLPLSFWVLPGQQSSNSSVLTVC